MARSTGPVLVAGGLAAANEAIFTPLATHQAENWDAAFRLVPATAGLALGLALLEQAASGFAMGLAWLLVVGVLVFPLGNAPPIVTNVNKILHL
jgi:hypothetical protein